MAFTSEQQKKIDNAQARNDAAKTKWAAAIEFWNTHFVNLKCYKDVKYDALAGATWFTPTDVSCNSGSGCTSGDKTVCKAEIDLIRNNIGTFRNDYAEFTAAQANYDKVFDEVTAEVANDPAFILEQKKNENQAKANAKANELKWIFGIVTVLVIAVGAFVYYKWFRN